MASKGSSCTAQKRQSEEVMITRENDKLFKPAESSNNTLENGDTTEHERNIRITCDAEIFYVEKELICQKSLYFQQLLEGPTHMKESQTNHVELKGVQLAALEAAIRHVRGEQIKISWQNIEDLLDVSSHLLIDGLLAQCSSFLLEKFSPGSYNDVVELSKQYALVDLFKDLKRIVTHRFHEFATSDALHQLEGEFMFHAVCQDCLDTPSEIFLFNSIISWLGAQEHTTDGEEEKLLSHVRYCLMTREDLNHINKTHQLPSSVKSLISTALQYQIDLDVKYSIPIKVDTQNKLRNTKPTLVLVSEGSWSQNHEILACKQSSSVSDPKTLQGLAFTLYQGIAHHRTCGAVSVDNCLYILSLHTVGGYDHNASVELHRFDPRTSKQHTLEFPPIQVVPTGFAAVGRKVVLCGGTSRSNTVFVDVVQSYTTDTGQWKLETPLPSALHNCAATGYQDILYVSGGLEVDRAGLSNRLHSVKLDIDSQWQALASMRFHRRDHTMIATENGRLYVCGGLSSNLPREYNRRIPIEMYDISTNQWTEIHQKSMLQGNSLGHYMTLSSQPDLLYSLGHELYQAQENQIWVTNLDDKSDKYLKDELFVTLPTKMKLNHTFAAYLDLNDTVLERFHANVDSESDGQ